MVKVALTGGAYQAHSVIASAQRSLNLFSEPMPEGQGEPMPAAHYPTPGTTLLGTIGTGPVRGVFQCATGHVYVVSGDTLYSVDVSNWTGTALGTLTPGLKTPVSMKDNGLDLVVVDGMIAGWTVNLASGAFAAIDTSDGVFSGADRVDYLDTFFILNKPATPQFYISGSLAVTFDSLDFANKEAYSDLLVVAVVAKRLVYLFGERTTEIWYDAGATDIGAGSFPFAAMQSEVFIDHGCAAKYSPAVYDNSVFWLTRDRQGQGIVMMVAGYQTKRVSTYAIEAELAEYERISDAIGFCYQMAGHTFYVLTFPHADKTWSYDIATGLWHQWAWIDTNGDEHRHRANCFWPVNDTLVVGDWQNGNLYALDNRVFTDNGQPIKRVRSFPHMLNDGKRVFYRQFLADLETGNAPQISDADAAAPPYDLKLVQLNTNISGLTRSNTSFGFPANTNFHTLLMSYWMCGPAAVPGSGGSGVCGVWPEFNSANFFTFDPGFGHGGPSGISLTNLSASAPFFQGTFNLPPPPGMLMHFMLSVDTHAQIVQAYINDQNVAVTGTWTGTPPFDFNIASLLNTWRWDVSNVIASGQFPALADAWVTNPPSFVDLSIVANRRKFINRDLTPVDLGATGTIPFGYQPAMYMSVRPGGVPADILVNRGSGGGAWSYDQNPPTSQTPGTCTLPPAPPPPTQMEQNLIWLSWSNDRGHSFGNPVSQSIGEAGEYRTSLQWQRLEYSRDRVFKLEWSTPMATALQGCWVDVTPAQS